MPIRPEDRAFYSSPRWRERAEYITTVRARGRCEVCGVAVHGQPIPNKPIRSDPRAELTAEELRRYLARHRFTVVYLTCSHWYDPTKENLAADNLRAACQCCHNRRDEPYRRANARRRREARA